MLTVTKNGAIGEAEPVVIGYYLDTQNRNYLLTNTLTSKEKDLGNVYALGSDKNQRTIEYFDGLGRLDESIIIEGSPLKKDIVIPTVYDPVGREYRKFLPFVHSGSTGLYKDKSTILSSTDEYIGDAKDFYNNPESEIIADANPYSETVYEKSAINRVLKQGQNGQIWQPNATASLDKTTKYSYESNAASQVYIWTWNRKDRVADAKTGTTFNYYPANDLQVKRTKNEKNYDVFEYYNKLGKLVLRKEQANAAASEFASTYYLYDDFGNLVVTIPPEAVANLTSQYFNTSDLTARRNFLGKWAIVYRYDKKNRLATKKHPGADSIYLVYDKRSRLVLTQDGNQRSVNKWTFTKYDALNRDLVIGVYTHATPVSQVDMQSYVETLQSTQNSFFEEYDGTATYHGYTNRVFPTQNQLVLTVNYYDNYKFQSLTNFTGLAFDSNHLSGLSAQNTLPLGQLTGTKTLALETGTWLPTVSIYDKKYQLIQYVSKNNGGGIDRSSIKYNFQGLLFQTKNSHAAFSEAQINIVKDYQYDASGNLTKLTSTINNLTPVVLFTNRYNELGELVEKNLLSKDGLNYAQSIDYRYNINGWTTKVNGLANDDLNDFFAYELKYEKPGANGGDAQFNGSLSELIWRSVGGNEQSYGFYYDVLDRLIEAKYYDLKNPQKDGFYNLKVGITGSKKGYDLNGNILYMERTGMPNEGLMDALTYEYSGSGNQLKRVSDAVAVQPTEVGFKDLNTSTDDYAYDLNGNLIKDLNKNIDLITYNHLNLPVTITKTGEGSVKYNYSAKGEKLTQQVFNTTGVLQKTTDYFGDYIYEGQKLRIVQHDEGRIIPIRNGAGTITGFEYEFFLTDHLGNVRVVFSEKNQTSVFVATMETEPTSLKTQEEATFPTLETDQRSTFSAYNHTPQDNSGYTRETSLLLRGESPYVHEMIGLAKSFPVNAGEIFDIEVYAKFSTPTTDPADLTGIFLSLATAFNLNPTGGGGNGEQAYQAFSDMFSPGVYVGREIPFEDDIAPKAYLNYILFDENFVLQDFGFDQISANAQGETAIHDYLNLHVKVLQKGYLYVYLSNENQTLIPVYFDDLKITKNTNIIQIQDYYPFGLSYNVYSSENAVKQDLQYGKKEIQDELSINWLDFGARMFMPEIARWGVIDPLIDELMEYSPYSYAFNNPMRFIDPDGMKPKECERCKEVVVGEDQYVMITDISVKKDSEGNVISVTVKYVLQNITDIEVRDKDTNELLEMRREIVTSSEESTFGPGGFQVNKNTGEPIPIPTNDIVVGEKLGLKRTETAYPQADPEFPVANKEKKSVVMTKPSRILKKNAKFLSSRAIEYAKTQQKSVLKKWADFVLETNREKGAGGKGVIHSVPKSKEQKDAQHRQRVDSIKKSWKDLYRWHKATEKKSGQ